ncbi:MAG: sterol desaturase family protein, partial [Bacteroidota bacterium]
MLFPIDLSMGQAWLMVVAFFWLRYSILVGFCFLLFYVWKKKAWHHLKIQPKFPKAKDISREVMYSFLTGLIFSSVILLVRLASQQGYTQIYLHFSDFGYVYLGLSFPLIILLHDTYFYWLHRWMHMPALYKYVHRVHHQSHNPTPWASFAFHPLEALLEVAFVGIIFVIPFHPLILVLFSFWVIAFNILGHLGYEIYPSWFVKHDVGRWYNTSTHHNMHHAWV